MLAGTRSRPQASRLVAVVAGACAYVALMAWALQTSYDIAGGVMVAHVLAVPSFLILRWVIRQEADRRLANLVVIALLLKLVGTFVRYGVTFGIYGSGDANGYHGVGSALATEFRNGQFDLELGFETLGTRFVEIFTGVVYLFTGATKLGGFLFYSWLGFLGLLLYYHAFREAFPDGDRRRYAALVFLLPSMLFWPSSIGKEAIITFSLGLSAYGASRLLNRRRSALVWLILGLALTMFVRPHIAITVLISLIVAYVVARGSATSFNAPLVKLANLVVLVLLFGFAFASLQNFFKLDERPVEAVFDNVEDRTTKGGSEFEAVSARSPADVPAAVVSVLFRPFPFEATNAGALLASFEGTLLLVLFVRSRHQLAFAFRQRRSAPYIVFAAVFSLLFVLAFSNFGNFGLIARQRVQLYPFVLVLLAVGVRGRSSRDRGSIPAPDGVDAFAPPHLRPLVQPVRR